MTEVYIVFAAILVIGLFIAATSYNKLLKMYYKYNTYAYVNITAGEFVVGVFAFLGLGDHKVAINKKPFSDAYIVNKKIIMLSEQNFHSKTISAIAVAAHEVGHVLQKREGSKLFAATYFLRLVNKIVDILLAPAILIGGGLILFAKADNLVFLGNIVLLVVLAFYVCIFMLKLVTIPLEFNASKRALNFLKQERILDVEELKGAKKVLRAAAMTYVGSIFHVIIRFFRSIVNSF